MKLMPILLASIMLNLSAINVCRSQDTIRTLRPGEISERAADTIKKRAFAKMVAGTEDISSIANYISFVPTDGKFALSGNYFFQTKKDTTKTRKQESFAIGFNGSGSITGGTVATLFDGGKLNTGTSLGLRLSWRLDNPFIGTVSSQTNEIAEKIKALIIEREQKIDSVKNALSLLLIRKEQAVLSIREATRKLNELVADTAGMRNALNGCSADSCRLRWTDSLITAKLKIFKEMQGITAAANDTVKLDELYTLSLVRRGVPVTRAQLTLLRRYGIRSNTMTLEDTLSNKVRKEYNDKMYEIEITTPIAACNVNWLSLVFNWNRYAFRTYNGSLPYSQALSKIDTSGFSAGLQFNFYKFDSLFKKSRLFNIALLYKRTNNLEDLSTSKLTEETLVPNGSTTRKSSTEYNVYTDPVELYNTVQLPVNYYRFFGKDLSFGWHAFGLADWRSTKKQIYNVGAGFIFGLNSASSKRLFNIEIFAEYKDIKREIVDEDIMGWKQVQAGLSVAIPFMIYKK
jgi:hypothetical protein